MDAQAGAGQDVSKKQAVIEIYKQHPLPVLTDPPQAAADGPAPPWRTTEADSGCAASWYTWMTFSW